MAPMASTKKAPPILIGGACVALMSLTHGHLLYASASGNTYVKLL
jgi:hypothetical protein